MLYFIIFAFFFRFFLDSIVYFVYKDLHYEKSFDSRKNTHNDEGDSK